MRKPTPLPEPYSPAPPHLSAESQELWRTLGPLHAVTIGRQALLKAALEARDLAEKCGQEITLHGMTTVTKTTGAVHLHPLAKVQIQARAQFAQLWRQLGITFERDFFGNRI